MKKDRLWLILFFYFKRGQNEIKIHYISKRKENLRMDKIIDKLDTVPGMILAEIVIIGIIILAAHYFIKDSEETTKVLWSIIPLTVVLMTGCVLGKLYDSRDDIELKSEATEELRCKLEDDLHVYIICGRLSRDDEENILDNFDKWVKTADWGDCYAYGLENYTLENPED